MQPDNTAGLFPTMPVLAEELTILGFPITSHISDGTGHYSGIRLYRGQPLREDILYLLTEEWSAGFPRDQAGYVALGEISGLADHLTCPMELREKVVDALQDIFAQFQDTANRINGMIYQGATLDDLCNLGETLLNNPVAIHDNWFMILAQSHSTDAIMPGNSSPWSLIPQEFLDEFRIDVEYQKTYQHRHAELWVHNRATSEDKTLYVNLYDLDVYLGRLLIMETQQCFRKKDYLIAQLLARQAIVLIKAKRGRKPLGNRSTDDILWDILCGKRTETGEFTIFLSTLRWEIADKFLCIRLQRQESVKTDAMEAVLHRELLLAIPGSYVMMISGQQCVIVNLTRTPMTLPGIHHALAPLCRDYFQYGGISSPITGMRDLKVAYTQAGEALNQAFRRRDHRWLVYFWDCALEYILMHLDTPMQFHHLVAPQLIVLQDYDREKDSQLFETLRVYLENERDIPKTAAQLIIHRTTLTYRLKKIRAMMDLNLDDPNIRLYLLLSLQMLEQEKTAALPSGSQPEKA